MMEHDDLLLLERLEEGLLAFVPGDGGVVEVGVVFDARGDLSGLVGVGQAAVDAVDAFLALEALGGLEVDEAVDGVELGHLGLGDAADGEP